MEREMEAGRLSTHIFPGDVVADIMARLPLKSLKRFKTVAKSWCSFIQSPSFNNQVAARYTRVYYEEMMREAYLRALNDDVQGLKEIISMSFNPSILLDINIDGQNLLHAAILHQKRKVFDFLLTQDEALLSRLARETDSHGNSILHLAALSEYQGPPTLTPPTQLSHQLRWFKDVKNISPPSLIRRLNNDGFSADQLFLDRHQQMVDAAQDWVKTVSRPLLHIACVNTVFLCNTLFRAQQAGAGAACMLLDMVSFLCWIYSLMSIMALQLSYLMLWDFLTKIHLWFLICIGSLFVGVNSTLLRLALTLISSNTSVANHGFLFLIPILIFSCKCVSRFNINFLEHLECVAKGFSKQQAYLIMFVFGGLVLILRFIID